MVIEADKFTFDEYIKEACIVDFFTTGCPSCEKFSTVYEQVAPKHSEYQFIKVNLDDDLTLAERYGISHIPTVIKFVKGKPVKTTTGYMDDTAFVEFIEGEEAAE